MQFNRSRIVSLRSLALIMMSFTTLAGCSSLVYRVDIHQGNYIEQRAIDQLKFGMSKEQVRYILGSPMLVENGYPNTWYYVHYHQDGDKNTSQKNLTVHFDDQETLLNIGGDYSVGDLFFELVDD
jgi:outer membrane protein assembly factor BamE